MAGIGFELKKLFRRKGLFASLRAYGYAGIICTGPMLLGVLLQLGILLLCSWAGAPRDQQDLLVCMITYTLLFSLTVTSFFSMPVTRYLADMLYEEQEQTILPSFWGSSSMMLVLGCTLYGLFLLVSGATLLQGLLCLWLFAEMIVNWNAMSYLTAIKDYRGILCSFLAAIVLAFGLGFVLAGEQHIIEQLKKVNTPVILIINKVDTVEKEKVLEYIDTYRKVFDFAEIIPTSALRGQNTDDVINSIFKYLPYGPQFYDEDIITDQPERAICAEIIREKALHALNDEVPHGIAVGIDRMKTRKTKSGSIIDMDATIVCERDSHKGIIIGKQGSMLKKIGTNARYEMERLLDCKVNLKLWVKVKKDWRDSDFLIKNFGYKEEE